jgi:tetraacyldisaccharide 4'-kinase
VAGRSGLAARAAATLQAHWWRSRPTFLTQALRPMSWLYRALADLHRALTEAHDAPVPVIVVGNLVVGGAGKTPTVIALVQALQAAGRHPGVLSRGYGRRGTDVVEVRPESATAAVGDEPVLIHRRTGAPVWVGAQRLAAAHALCAAHPEVDVLVSDDGLQHHALGRVAELVVFDDRGVGNGLVLPAGPLRQPMPARLHAGAFVLYTGTRASTPLPGALATRALGLVWPLAAWWRGDAQAARPISALQGRPVLAAAGLAAPEKFFTMLEDAGLALHRLPLPDHASFDPLPWPTDQAQCVLVTEKDAVKLQPGRPGTAGVWVVPLDFTLPAELVRALVARLPDLLPPPPSA